MVAVVLSGVGNDGVSGASVVGARGGCLVAQSPEDALFPGPKRTRRISRRGGIPVQRLRGPINRVLGGEQVEDVELEGHDRRGKPVRVLIEIAPLEKLPGADGTLGAILLVSAERAG